jgi:hypothetical protein
VIYRLNFSLNQSTILLNLTVRTLLDLEEERVPGLVKTVGNRPTNSPEEEKGTNPGTSQPAKQGFINLILSLPT